MQEIYTTYTYRSVPGNLGGRGVDGAVNVVAALGVHTHRTEKPPREDDEAVVRIRWCAHTSHRETSKRG